jgi:hypothetical protein
MLDFIKFVHLSSLVVWMGTVVFFSFFAAPGIFKALPRETAGEVVGAIFPSYWMTGYSSSLAALFSLLVISYAEKSFPVARVLVLAVMTGTTFYSGLVVGGEAAAIKARIKAAEDKEVKESLRAVFKKVHRRSSVLNMTVLALGAVVVFLTARGLRL